MKAFILLLILTFFSNGTFAFPTSFDLGSANIQESKIGEGAIAMGFVSKEMCSCLFVEQNSREYCDDYIMLEGLDEINFKVRVDMSKKTVRASTGLFIVKKAAYIDTKRGCSQTQ